MTSTLTCLELLILTILGLTLFTATSGASEAPPGTPRPARVAKLAQVQRDDHVRLHVQIGRLGVAAARPVSFSFPRVPRHVARRDALGRRQQHASSSSTCTSTGLERRFARSAAANGRWRFSRVRRHTDWPKTLVWIPQPIPVAARRFNSVQIG